MSVPGENWVTLLGCKDKHGNPYTHDIRKAHLSEMKRFACGKGATKEGHPCRAIAITNFGQEIPLLTEEHVALAEKAMGLAPLPKEEPKAVVISPVAVPNRTEDYVELKRQQAEIELKIKAVAGPKPTNTDPTKGPTEPKLPPLVTHDQ